MTAGRRQFAGESSTFEPSPVDCRRFSFPAIPPAIQPRGEPMTAKELREKRAALAAKIREMADKLNADKRDFTAEEKPAWEAVNADYDAMSRQIEIAERVERVAADNAEPRNLPGREDTSHTPEAVRNIDRDTSLAVAHWALARSKPSLVTEEHVAATKRMGWHPGDNEIVLRLNADTGSFERRQSYFRTGRGEAAYREARALSTQIGQTGGFTIAPNFNSSIESALLYYGPMMQLATPLRTSTAADFPMMTDNETSKTGSYVGENTAITTTEGVTIRQVVFHAYKATTNAILVPFELFRDTSINLTQYLGDKLGERLGRFINTECTTGAVKTKGVVTSAATGVSAASATAIAFDDILGLEHSVDLAYRNLPGAGFMCHDTTALALRKLKDGQGQYLWSDGTQAGQPDRLDGKPLYINNDMASSISSTAISVLFGAFPKYHIRMVNEIRLAMTDQRYWEYDQTAFAAYVYFDGNVVDAGTSPIKKLTH